jgi:hypothetical protein
MAMPLLLPDKVIRLQQINLITLVEKHLTSALFLAEKIK